MKNILFLTLYDINDFNSKGLYNDFAKSLINNDVSVTIVSPLEKRKKENTKIIIDGNNKILKVKVGNLTKTKNILEKGLSTLMLEYQYLKAIKKYLSDTKYDLIIYSTPPITFNKVINYFKIKYNAKSYLMLKDIFPQNAVDLDMMKKNGIIYRIFRRKEQNLYKLSDYIGCMSKANIKYIINNNNVNKNKVELFPNSIKINESKRIEDNDIIRLKSKYNIPLDSTIFLYGGNLGKPQGIDFLIDVAKSFHKVNNGYLLIIGDGTEFDRLNQSIFGINNVSIFKSLDKQEYDKLIQTTDVGLIFLDKRFTIPNFPSRLLSYMENSMPVIAATDVNTDIGDVIVESNSGYWVESGDLDEFINYANKFSSNPELIYSMGKKSRKYLEENYDIDNNIYKILEKVID